MREHRMLCLCSILRKETTFHPRSQQLPSVERRHCVSNALSTLCFLLHSWSVYEVTVWGFLVLFAFMFFWFCFVLGFFSGSGVHAALMFSPRSGKSYSWMMKGQGFKQYTEAFISLENLLCLKRFNGITVQEVPWRKLGESFEVWSVIYIFKRLPFLTRAFT